MADDEKGGRLWMIAGAVVVATLLGLVLYAVNRAPPPQQSSRRIHVPLGDAPSKGPPEALVTIVEFSDFQCPHCRTASKAVARLMERRPEEVRLFFRHSPIPMAHPQAEAAAMASMAAAEQGRFWEYHDALFAHPERLSERGEAYLDEIAQELGLDMVAFETRRTHPELRRAVRADRRLLLRRGQGAVPTFFINGRLLRGAVPLDQLLEVVDEERERAQAALERGIARERLYEEVTGGGQRSPDAG